MYPKKHSGRMGRRACMLRVGMIAFARRCVRAFTGAGNMARRRRERSFPELRFPSDWRLSVACRGHVHSSARACTHLFGSEPDPSRLAGSITLTMLCWLFTVVFAAIAMVRYLKQRCASAAIPQQRAAAPQSCAAGARQRPPTRIPPVRRSIGAALHLPSPLRAPRPDAWSLDVLRRVEWKR